MSKLLIVLVIIVVLGYTAQARERLPWALYVGGGASPLSGDYGQVWKTGLHLTGGVRASVVAGLQVVPKMEYHMFPIDKKGLAISGGTLTTYMIGFDARYLFGYESAQVMPTILAGVGMATASISELSGGGESVHFGRETKPYYEFGGGLVFRAWTTVKPFVTVRYLTVLLGGTPLTYTPITLGVLVDLPN